MVKLKDHIISLVAVFMALGIGILIGSGMSDDLLIKQQRLTIEQMTTDFRMMRDERMELESQVEMLNRDLHYWEQYQEAVYPRLVTGILQKKIAVVSHGTEKPEEFIKILENADVDLTGTIHVNTKQEWSDSEGMLAGALFSLMTGIYPAEHDNILLDTMVMAEKVQIQFNEQDSPEYVILYVGDRENTNLHFVLTLSRLLVDSGLSVAVVETSEIQDSILGSLKGLDISTIDNADTVFGQVSLIAVLQGQVGHFGFKKTAEQFLPDLSKL